MPLVFLFFISYSIFLDASKIDHRIVSECKQNFTSFIPLNCTHFFNETRDFQETFSTCLSHAQIHTTLPQSCYQLQASWQSFKYAIWVAIPVFLSTLLVIPILNAVFEIVSKRARCCGGKDPDDIPLQTITTEPTPNQAHKPEPVYLKTWTSKLLDSITMVMSGALGCVTLGWLFQLGQSWTTAKGACQYDEDHRKAG